MKRTRLLICTLLVLGAGIAVAVALLLARPATQSANDTAGSGLAGDPRTMGGGPPMSMPGVRFMAMPGGPPMGMFPGPPERTAAVAVGKHLFIARGDIVYQLDVDSLEMINQQDLPEPEDMGPSGR